MAKIQCYPRHHSSSIAAKIKDLTLCFKQKFPDLLIRVQFEDLSWSKHGKRTESGYYYYLAHSQKNCFHSQIKWKTAHLLREFGIGVWEVNPKNSSQQCNYCDHHEKGQRKGKTFTCKNKEHLTPSGKTYTCNSDLNASRNVALFPPRQLTPILA